MLGTDGEREKKVPQKAPKESSELPYQMRREIMEAERWWPNQTASDNIVARSNEIRLQDEMG